MSAEELVDVYDIEGNRTGKMVVRGTTIGDDEFFMAVHVWIANSKGELLIQKRGSKTNFMPNMWSVTGGVVGAKEEPANAACRETLEEIGIRLERGELQFLICKQDSMSLKYLSSVWLAKKDFSLEEIVVQEEEVAGVKWVSLDELQQFVDDGKFARNVLFALDKVIELAEIL